MKIAIAIPAYNCEQQISRVLLELDSVLVDQKLVTKVFIIENNSTDSTLEAAIRDIANSKNRHLFEVYQNLQNIGLGGTHKIALTLAKESGCSHLLVIHGDHQASTFDIPLMISRMTAAQGITTLGSRFQEMKNLSGYSHFRKIGNLVLNILYSAGTGRKISDLGSGLNIYRLSELEPEVYQKFDNGFTFNMDMLLHLVRSKIPFQYVPIKWSTVDQISNAKSLKVGIETLKKLIFWLVKSEPAQQGHYHSRNVTRPSV